MAPTPASSVNNSVIDVSSGSESPARRSACHHRRPAPAQSEAVTIAAPAAVMPMRKAPVFASGIARHTYHAESEIGAASSPIGTPNTAASAGAAPISTWTSSASSAPARLHASRCSLSRSRSPRMGCNGASDLDVDAAHDHDALHHQPVPGGLRPGAAILRASHDGSHLIRDGPVRRHPDLNSAPQHEYINHGLPVLGARLPQVELDAAHDGREFPTTKRRRGNAALDAGPHREFRE